MAIMTDEGRAAKRIYKSKWDKAHSEHNKAYNAAYWNRKAEELKKGSINLKTYNDN